MTDPAMIPSDPLSAGGIPAPDPAGVTPGAGDLTPAPQADAAPVPVETCPDCGHAAAAHHAGRCLIMLGDYGTGGPCPCGTVEAVPV